MDKDLTYASPYPWDDEEMETSVKASNKMLCEKPFIGSGFQSVQKHLGPRTQLNDTAKELLKNLLHEHNVKLEDHGGDLGTNAEALYVMHMTTQRWPPLQESQDEETLQMARDGKLSFFSSILSTMETNDPPVSTKRLIRHSCLTVKPGDLPGNVDAKDFVLAALHFLSSVLKSVPNVRFPSLPLIRPVQWTGDLEKRNFEKVGDWKLDDIQEKVNNLEQLFVRSPSTWKWLRREAFSPRLSSDDETTFFLKGSIPAGASAKKVKVGVKRKAPSPVPSSEPSTSLVEAVESSSTAAVEASIEPDEEGTEQISDPARS